MLGSFTAKSGFRNEDVVVAKFKAWEEDKDAQKWLELMEYSLNEIEKVEAIRIHGYKTDVQVQVTIYLEKAIAVENLSVKLVSNPRGFNQIDKRWVDRYAEMWNIPEDIVNALKLFTGQISPKPKGLRDNRRLFLNEMDPEMQKKIVDFFSCNKFLIISDLLKGRGKFSAGWMLVALRLEDDTRWVLKSINHVINVFGIGDVRITKRGSLRIGKITMQRKGGNYGRETAKMLQFKINPVELFGV